MRPRTIWTLRGMAFRDRLRHPNLVVSDVTYMEVLELAEGKPRS